MRNKLRYIIPFFSLVFAVFLFFGFSQTARAETSIREEFIEVNDVTYRVLVKRDDYRGAGNICYYVCDSSDDNYINNIGGYCTENGFGFSGNGNTPFGYILYYANTDTYGTYYSISNANWSSDETTDTWYVYLFDTSDDFVNYVTGKADSSNANNYNDMIVHSRPSGSVGSPSNNDYFYSHYVCTVYYKDGSSKQDYIFNVNNSLSADVLDCFVGVGGRPLDSEPDLYEHYKWILYDSSVTHVAVTITFEYSYSVRSSDGSVGGVKKPGRSSSLHYRITKDMLTDDYDLESTEVYNPETTEVTSTSIVSSDGSNNISVVVNNNPEFTNNPGSGTGTGSNIFDVNNETYFGLPDTGDLLENVDSAFGLTGGNGYFALMNQFLDAVPNEIWTLIGMALSVSIICLVIKIFRGM